MVLGIEAIAIKNTRFRHLFQILVACEQILGASGNRWPVRQQPWLEGQNIPY